MLGLRFSRQELVFSVSVQYANVCGRFKSLNEELFHALHFILCRQQNTAEFDPRNPGASGFHEAPQFREAISNGDNAWGDAGRDGSDPFDAEGPAGNQKGLNQDAMDLYMSYCEYSCLTACQVFLHVVEKAIVEDL